MLANPITKMVCFHFKLNVPALMPAKIIPYGSRPACRALENRLLVEKSPQDKNTGSKK